MISSQGVSCVHEDMQNPALTKTTSKVCIGSASLFSSDGTRPDNSHTPLLEVVSAVRVLELFGQVETAKGVHGFTT
jgi:hypothetical protein